MPRGDSRGKSQAESSQQGRADCTFRGQVGWAIAIWILTLIKSLFEVLLSAPVHVFLYYVNEGLPEVPGSVG